MTIVWPDAANDAQANRIVAEMASTIQAAASAHDAGIRYIFATDAHSTQDVLSSYGEDNVAEMRVVSEKYDACGMFQRQQNGGWLWSRMGEQE